MTELEKFIAAQEGKTISVAVYDFKTGQEILVNPDEAFHPASTIKVHVMMEVFRQAGQGLLRLEETVPIVNSFTSIADGTAFSLSEVDDAEQTLYRRPGESESIAELTRLMIVRSSNLATNILLKRIGAQSVKDLIDALGIEGIHFLRGIDDGAAFRAGMNNSATARGLTHSMRLIAEKRVVPDPGAARMIDILLQQEFNESIPAQLPKGVRVAHKTGWTGNVHHDTGIVYPADRRPYVLSIMSRGFSESQDAEAHACMAAISRLIYESLS